MFHRLASLISKELVQMLRDRMLLVFALCGPALQLILLGNAISRDIQDIPVAVVDYDLTSLSRDIVTALDNTVELKVVSFPGSLDEARRQMDEGDIMGVAVIPRGFMADLQSPTAVPQVQVFLDGASSFIAGRALGAAQGALDSLIDETLGASDARSRADIDVHIDALFNQTLDLRPDSITSQMALIAFEITTLVAVMGIVREREIGTIEMLSITPLRRLELIAGKAITPLIIGVINFLVMFVVTQVVFEVPQRGAFALLLALTVLYLGCEVGYALMISTIARSQQQAVTIVFVWVMTAMALSGFLVPIATLPETMQWISWAVPLRHYLTVIRAVMLKGAGLASLLPEVAAMITLTVVMVSLTTRTLSRAID